MSGNIQAVNSRHYKPSEKMFQNVCYKAQSDQSAKNQHPESLHQKNPRKYYCKITGVVLTILLLLSIMAGAFGGLYGKFSQLDAEIAALQMKLDRTMEALDSFQAIGATPALPADSCESVHEESPSFPTGFYWVRTVNGSATRIYCDMQRECGGIIGGWARVAYLNITDPNARCPPGLEGRTYLGDKRTCVLPETMQSSCVSVFYNTMGIEFSRVCGRILGYQYRSPDAFFKFNTMTPITIDSNYVDGISLTRGTPREHIWTFAGGDCPQSCIHFRPDFVPINQFFCDGLKYPNCTDFCNVQLWNGKQCDPNSKWFYNQLPQVKGDLVELRLCQDEGAFSEQTPLVEIELYVQ